MALVLEKATDDQAQLIAATGLTEPALVAGILGRDQRAWVRKTLVAKATDRALVGRLAQSDPDPSARAAATRRFAELK